jgi:hypothetical protein
MSDKIYADRQPADKLVCEIDYSSDSGLSELKTLTKDAKFVCRGCGRAATSDENLCRPEWIY